MAAKKLTPAEVKKRDKKAYRLAVMKDLCEKVSNSEWGIGYWCHKGRGLFPTGMTVRAWMDEDPELFAMFARAKSDQAEFMEETLNRIADEECVAPLYDLKGQPLRNSKGELILGTSAVGVQHARLRIDTRKWLMAKLKPRKYGDRTTLAGDPDAPLNPAPKADLSKLTDAELTAYIALQTKLEGGKA